MWTTFRLGTVEVWDRTGDYTRVGEGQRRRQVIEVGLVKDSNNVSDSVLRTFNTRVLSRNGPHLCTTFTQRRGVNLTLGETKRVVR